MVVSAVSILIVDVLITAFIWSVLGFESIKNLFIYYENEFIDYSFFTDTVDVVLLSFLKSIFLSLAYWRTRHNFTKFLKFCIVSIPLLSFLFLTVKLVFILWDTKQKEMQYISNTIVVLLSIMFCVIEMTHGIKTVKRDGVPLQNELTFDEEEEEENQEENKNEKELKLKNNEDKKEKKKHSSFKRIAILLIPEIPLIILGTVSMILTSIFFLMIPIYMGSIVKVISSTKNYSQLVNAIFMLSIIAIFNSFFYFIETWAFSLTGNSHFFISFFFFLRKIVQ